MTTALDMLASAATFFLFASIKSTVLVALVLVTQKALGRYLSANGRHALWLAVVISLVTPLGFDLHLPSRPALDALMQAPQARTGSALDAGFTAAMATDVVAAAPANVNAVTVTPAQSAGFRWDIALPLAWLAGMLAVLAAMAISHRRFAALARKGSLAPANVQATLHACEQQAGCRTAIRLLASSNLRAPVVAGLFKPVLLWPAGLEALLTPAQLQHVLMHEVMHVKRRDILGACVVAVLQALHWFIPAIWIAFSALRQDREMACDASTVHALRTVDAHDYAHTLIQLGALRPQPLRAEAGLGILDSHAQLGKRIHMLAQAADPTARHFLSGLLLVAFAGLAFGQPALPSAAVAAVIEQAPVQVAAVERAPAPVVVVQHAAERARVATNPGVTADVVAPAVKAASAPAVVQEMANLAEAPEAPIVANAVQAVLVEPARAELVLASADTVIAVPASIPATHTIAAAQVAAQAAAPAPAAVAQAEQTDVQVCRRETLPGSRVRSLVCHTEKQWIETSLQAPRSSAFVRSLYPRDFDGAGNNPPTLLLRGVGL